MIFVSCTECRAPMLARDRVCPHCGTAREPARRVTAAIVMLAGGALTGCFPIAEPAYGIADSGESDWGDTSESESMSTTYEGPYTTTTSPGTTQGTSPIPDPTAFTTGDESSGGDDTTSTTDASSDNESSSDDGTTTERGGTDDESTGSESTGNESTGSESSSDGS